MADPALIVAVEARLDKFEKALKEAGLIAQQQIDAIEQRFARTDIGSSVARGTAIGNIAFKAIEGAVEGFINKIKEAIAEIEKMGDVIKKTGQSAEQLQRFAFAGALSGISKTDVLTGIDKMGQAFSEAVRHQTKLADLLDTNGIKFKDQQGVQVATNEQFRIAERLIALAGDRWEKIEMAKLLGLTEQWVDALDKGVGSFERIAAEAKKIDPEMRRQIQHVEALRDLARQLVGATQGMGSSLVTHVLPAYSALSDIVLSILQGLAKAAEGGLLEEQAKRMLEIWTAVDEAVKKAVKDANRINVPPGGPKPSQIKQPAGDKDAFGRQVDQVEKHIAVMKADAEAVGETAGEHERLRVEAVLTAAAMKEGGKVTDAQRHEIERLAEEAGETKQRLVELAAAQQELNAASKEFGSALADGLKAAIFEGQKLDEVLRNIGKRLASKAIDKLFDLLFSTQAGQGSPFILQALGIRARMAGGPVQAGRPFVVGERGPELFVPRHGGVVLPNSAVRGTGGRALTVAPIYNIDNRGASIDAVARLETALVAVNRSIEARAVQAVSSFSQRMA